MSNTQDGGPAFPVSGEVFHYGDGSYSESSREGMTLRDYFAGQALIRLTGADRDGVHGPDILAMCCYSLADAMIKARGAA